jgi:nucleotide-binding universal stress UspA family protein
VDREPRPQIALDAALAIARALDTTLERITLLFVGEAGEMPTLDTSAARGAACERRACKGGVVEAILGAAEDADLIAMATRGRAGFLAALRGSTTERVLRRAPCPVLAVPAPTAPGSS